MPYGFWTNLRFTCPGKSSQTIPTARGQVNVPVITDYDIIFRTLSTATKAPIYALKCDLLEKSGEANWEKRAKRENCKDCAIRESRVDNDPLGITHKSFGLCTVANDNMLPYARESNFVTDPGKIALERLESQSWEKHQWGFRRSYHFQKGFISNDCNIIQNKNRAPDSFPLEI